MNELLHEEIWAGHKAFIIQKNFFSHCHGSVLCVSLVGHPNCVALCSEGYDGIRNVCFPLR